jgi:hypothetical protein
MHLTFYRRERLILHEKYGEFGILMFAMQNEGIIYLFIYPNS